MAIDEITIQGFKSIRSVENLALAPINVLIGANGSGKSNFLGVFPFIHAIRLGDERRYVAREGGAERVLHHGSEQTQRISLHIRFSGHFSYRVDLQPTTSDRLFVDEEWLELARRRVRLDTIDPDGDEDTAALDRRLSKWRTYQFHDTSRRSPMRKTAEVGDNRRLRGDGANLPAFLYLLKRKYHREYLRIRDVVRLIAPFFRDFVLEPDEFNENTIRLEWLHRGVDAYFDTSAMSDGTLRFIALTTLLLQPKELRPDVILLDEPELGLHPMAISRLASMVRTAAVDSQIILATQSPILLDHFDPDDVLVAERSKGATRFTRLDGSDLAEWLEEYSLGQLWEKNEIGGRPIPERT